jgi:hypothetical protein
MKGIRAPVSVQRRAGLQREQIRAAVVWDGLVPPEHQAAFAHKLRAPDGREVVARWITDTLFADGGGHWWVEGREGGCSAAYLSARGYAYVATLEAGAGNALMETRNG